MICSPYLTAKKGRKEGKKEWFDDGGEKEERKEGKKEGKEKLFILEVHTNNNNNKL